MKYVLEKRNYSYDNGIYRAIFRIVIPYGRGVGITVEDVLAIIKPQKIPDCEIYSIRPRDNISHRRTLEFLGDINKKGNPEDDMEGGSSSDELKQNLSILPTRDWHEYGTIQSEEDLGSVIYSWYMVIEAKDLQKISEQYESIVTRWKITDEETKRITKYVELIPLDNQQVKKLSTILWKSNDLTDMKNSTTMQYRYTGLGFYKKGVLQDNTGIPLGFDIYSSETLEQESKKSRVVINFNKRTKTRALVAIPRLSRMEDFRLDNGKEDNKAPLSSVVGQLIANDIIIGAKVNPKTGATKVPQVVHLSLNDFAYDLLNEQELLIRRASYYDRVDMSTVSINPLQPFGKFDEESELYSQFQDKIATIIDIMSDYTLDNSSKNNIRNAVQNTYAKYWSDKVDTRSLLTTNNMSFDTISSVINDIDRSLRLAESQNREKKVDRLDDISMSIKQAIGEVGRVLSSHTTFEPSKSRQVYYDFSRLSDRMKVVQFVNSLNIIISRMSKGDCLIIHGVDRIPPKVFADYAKKEVVERCEARGIRVVYLFDETMTGNGRSFIEYSNILYEDFYDSLDYQILGYTPSDSLPQLENLYRNSFNTQVKVDISASGAKGRVMFVDKSTMHNEVVDIARELPL